MALISLKNVTIAFEGITALQNVCFEVHRGDYLLIAGENGSGKSTLIRAMLGLIRPNSGSIILGDGMKKNQIGYLPQQTAAQRDFPASVEEVVLSGCANQLGARFFYTQAQRQKAHEKMRMLDIENLSGKSYRNLSGGQQQRTLLARALCAADSLLLLDEPTTGLDTGSSAELYQIIRKLNRENHMAVVMVSHDLSCASEDARHVLVINRGIDYSGPVEEYRKRYGVKAVNA